MKLKNKKNLVALFSVLGGALQAQTVNLGNFIISPGTIVSSVGAVDNTSTGNIFNDGELCLYSHYNNDGLVTFSSGINKGLTRMRGILGYQEISGTMPMQWYDAEFKNLSIQPAFHLYNQVSIAGKSDFQDGIIDNDNYGGLLILESEAAIINVGDNSFVNGKVQKNGSKVFIYPIGDKNKYRFSGISAPEETLSSFTGKYFYEDSNDLYSHSNKADGIILINDKEYWTLDKTAGNSDVMLTLSWDENSTTPEEIAALPENLIHIVRWDRVQKRWIDEGGVVDRDKKTVTTAVNVSGYNVFTTGRTDRGIVLACTTLTVYNAVSPNGDNKNDYFKISGLLECSSDNTVEIYNRWGVKVFETNNYDSNGNVFNGYSQGRLTISKGQLLPTGTYFYILNFRYSGDTSQTIKKSGYLYLNTD